MVTKNMENAITTPNSTMISSSLSSASKRFRFDSFAMEFACKEKDISPVSTTHSLSSSSHSINATDTEIVDNDSGIGKYLIFNTIFLNLPSIEMNDNLLKFLRCINYNIGILKVSLR